MKALALLMILTLPAPALALDAVDLALAFEIAGGSRKALRLGEFQRLILLSQFDFDAEVGSAKAARVADLRAEADELEAEAALLDSEADDLES